MPIPTKKFPAKKVDVPEVENKQPSEGGGGSEVSNYPEDKSGLGAETPTSPDGGSVTTTYDVNSRPLVSTDAQLAQTQVQVTPMTARHSASAWERLSL